jgi:hypothetical protein
MKRILLLFLVTGTILLSACGAGTTPSPTEAPTTPSPEPTATPAKFVVSNLKVVAASDLGEGYYHITVDIENTGGLKGAYQLKAGVDDEPMEPVEIELNPGEKKTVTLSGAESTIHTLAVRYQYGGLSGREHVVAIDGLSETVTFPQRTVSVPTTPPRTSEPPKPAYKLQLLFLQGLIIDQRWLQVTGEVKNVSGVSLKDVEAVITGLSKEGIVLKTASALLEKNPISDNQTSLFRVSADCGLGTTVTQYRIGFRFLSGETIPYEDKREQK